MNNRMSLSAKGSPANFKAWLAEAPHPPSELFQAIRTALLYPGSGVGPSQLIEIQ